MVQRTNKFRRVWQNRDNGNGSPNMRFYHLVLMKYLHEFNVLSHT